MSEGPGVCLAWHRPVLVFPLGVKLSAYGNFEQAQYKGADKGQLATVVRRTVRSTVQTRFSLLVLLRHRNKLRLGQFRNAGWAACYGAHAHKSPVCRFFFDFFLG